MQNIDTPNINCLNCGDKIAELQKFCSSCGQKTNTHRLSMHDIWHEVIHAFTHADKGILFLIKGLLQHPHIVIKEYLDGKRIKYFSPFTFLLLIVGIATIVMNSSGFMIENPAYLSMSNNPIKTFFTKHVNLIILINVPILAFLSSIFFKGQLNYAESLVFAAYMSGLRSIFFTLIIAPLWMILHQYYYAILITYILLWFLFFAFVCTKIYKGKLLFVFSKGILITLLTQAITIALTSFSIYIYFKYFH